MEVKKKHPRRAVLLGRLSEYSVPLAALVMVVINGVQGSWDVIAPWFLVGIIALVYQHRLERAWSWGWRDGQNETLRRVMPHVRLERADLEQLHGAFMDEGPTWRQRQDELAQIDAKATMKATTEELERLWTP